jgi:hypothetical protein
VAVDDRTGNLLKDDEVGDVATLNFTIVRPPEDRGTFLD